MLLICLMDMFEITNFLFFLLLLLLYIFNALICLGKRWKVENLKDISARGYAFICNIHPFCHPHLVSGPPLSCPCPLLEHCYQTLSSWRSGNCAGPSAPVHFHLVTGVTGWLVAGSAVTDSAATDSAAGAAVPPGSFLGWVLMMS